MKKTALLALLCLAGLWLNAKDYLQFNVVVQGGGNVKIETTAKNLGSEDLPQAVSGDTVTKTLKVPVTGRTRDINVSFRLTGTGKVKMTVQGVRVAAPKKTDNNNDGKNMTSTTTCWFALDQVRINGKELKPKRGAKFNVGTPNALISTPANKYSGFASFKSGETINFHSTIAPAKAVKNTQKAAKSGSKAKKKK